MFNRFKIKSRLYLLVGTLSLFMLLVGLYGIRELSQAHDALRSVYEDNTVALSHLSTVESENLRIRLNLATLLLKPTREIIDDILSKNGDHVSIITKELKQYSEIPMTPEEQEIAHATARDIDTYNSEGILPLESLIRSGKIEDAKTFYMTNFIGMYSVVTSDMKKLSSMQIEQAKSKYDTFAADYKLTKIIFTVLMLGGLVIGFAVAWGIISGISRSLNAVKEVTEAAAKGDLTRDVPVISKDEIGDVAESFNIMIRNVKRVVGSINNSTATLASSSEELSATSEELSKGVSDLSVQTDQVVTAMTEVSQTIVDMAKNAADAADAATRSVETADAGKENIDLATEGMVTIAATVSKSAEMIEMLGKNSVQIGEIVTVINAIAEQTNLLALNAAIEAARAGDQGRGFAVVADEVRKLAERTGQATRDISKRIETIQDDTKKSVAAVKKGATEVDKGKGLVNSAKDALSSIVIVSGKSTDMVQRIAAATEQQSAATDQVSRSMENIADFSRRTATSTEQIKSSAGSLARLALDLKENTAWFRV